MDRGRSRAGSFRSRDRRPPSGEETERGGRRGQRTDDNAWRGRGGRTGADERPSYRIDSRRRSSGEDPRSAAQTSEWSEWASGQRKKFSAEKGQKYSPARTGEAAPRLIKRSEKSVNSSGEKSNSGWDSKSRGQDDSLGI